MFYQNYNNRVTLSLNVSNFLSLPFSENHSELRMTAWRPHFPVVLTSACSCVKLWGLFRFLFVSIMQARCSPGSRVSGRDLRNSEIRPHVVARPFLTEQQRLRCQSILGFIYPTSGCFPLFYISVEIFISRAHFRLLSLLFSNSSTQTSVCGVDVCDGASWPALASENPPGGLNTPGWPLRRRTGMSLSMN